MRAACQSHWRSAVSQYVVAKTFEKGLHTEKLKFTDVILKPDLQ
jgi:hypothetical protein